MKKFLPLGFLVVVVLLFFRQFIIGGFLPIPSDTIVGLYYPYRDYFAKEYPRGFPFKNFLITDPVRQLYPWKQLAIQLEKQSQLPLWDPYNFSGTPLLANFQSAPFYPLNLFYFFLPFNYSWSLLILLQPILGGIFMFLYLRNLRLHRTASIFGSIAFAFSGFNVAWMEWNTVVQTVLWLPLMLLSVDKINTSFSDNAKLTFGKFSAGKIQNSKMQAKNQKFLLWPVIFLIALCSSFFAGHLQTFFYVFLVVFAYIVIKIIRAIRRKELILLFLISCFLFLLVTAIQWVPTLQFILLSARNTDQAIWQNPGWFIPWQNIVQFIAPDFFGNPATLNYFGIWNYAEFVGYIGIVPLIFALFAIFLSRDKITYFFSAILLLGLLFALPTPLAKLPFILHIPFLATAQPTRLLAIIDFSLAILAAMGMDFYLQQKKKIALPMIFLATVFVVLFGLAKLAHAFLPQQQSIILHNLIFPSVIFICSIVIIFANFIIKPNLQKYIILLLICLTIFDLLRFGEKFTPFTNPAFLFPQTKVISFLQQNIGTFRVMTTDSRIFPPNFSLPYKIQSVDGYDPLYLQNYASLIAASERGEPNINPPFGFNRIITPHNINSSVINLLGVKYVLSLSDMKNPQFKKVFQEGGTRVYENSLVFPRVFFAKSLVVSGDNQDIINKIFAKDLHLNKIAIITSFNSSTKPTLTLGTASISKYSQNLVQIETKNLGSGFLVLTDTFYPTWHAYVDNQEVKIYPTDFAFRGIFVPQGNHTVTFSDRMF